MAEGKLASYEPLVKTYMETLEKVQDLETTSWAGFTFHLL